MGSTPVNWYHPRLLTTKWYPQPTQWGDKCLSACAAGNPAGQVKFLSYWPGTGMAGLTIQWRLPQIEPEDWLREVRVLHCRLSSDQYPMSLRLSSDLASNIFLTLPGIKFRSIYPQSVAILTEFSRLVSSEIQEIYSQLNEKRWQGKDRTLFWWIKQECTLNDWWTLYLSEPHEIRTRPFRMKFRLQFFHLSSVLETSKISVSSTNDWHSNVITNSYRTLFALLHNQIADNRIVYILQVQTVSSL